MTAKVMTDEMIRAKWIFRVLCDGEFVYETWQIGGDEQCARDYAEVILAVHVDERIATIGGLAVSLHTYTCEVYRREALLTADTSRSHVPPEERR